MSNRQQMSNADAAWLHMDRPTNLMVITSVLWFDEPIDRERVRQVVAERLVKPFVRFRQRAVESALPLRGPHWEDDPNFDLDRHIHHLALPAPGGAAELEELVSDLMSTPLDRSKPLWDLYLVDGYGTGSAMVSRMHHCIADGIALARVMLSLTDEDPDAGIAGEGADGGPRQGRVDALIRTATAPVRAARSVAGALLHEGAETLVHPSEAAHLAGEAAKDVRVLRKLLLTGPDAKTVFKGRMGATRRAAWSSEFDLDKVKAIGHSAGATVNDVLVAALTGGLRDYLRQRDSLTDELRAMVPFNLRPLDKPLPSTLGNDFGLVYLPLPVGIRSTRERLAAVKSAMDEIKHSPEGPIAYGILGLVGLTPVDIEKLIVDLFSAKASMVVTNVPGPRQPVYLAGSPVRGVLVWAPTSGSVAMSVSIMSYDGRVTVGVMADAHLVPDPDRIAAGFERELARLRRAYLRKPAADGKSAGRAKSRRARAGTR
jgi:diacylglycerol O-acyltransferase